MIDSILLGNDIHLTFSFTKLKGKALR